MPRGHHTLLDQLAAAGLISARQQEDGTITVTIAAGYHELAKLAPPNTINNHGALQNAILRTVRDYPDDKVPVEHVYQEVVAQLPVPNKRDTRRYRAQRAAEKLIFKGKLKCASDHVWLPSHSA